MNIYLLYWKHKYRAVEYFAKVLASALRDNGCRTSTIGIQEPQAAAEVARMISDRDADLVIALTPDALGFKARGKTLMELMPCRFAILFMDSPIYLARQMARLVRKLPDDTLMLFPDARQAQQARDHFDESHSGRFITHFFPLGSIPPVPRAASTDEPAFDLVLLMNIDDQISAEFVRHDQWTGEFPAITPGVPTGARAKIARLARQLVPGHYDLDLVDLLSQETGLRQPLGVNADNALATTFDSYVKRYRRVAAGKALIESAYTRSLRVAVGGTGWDRIGEIPRAWVRLDEVTYKGQLPIFGKSKAVFNLDPNWTASIHDRVLNAAACGAIAVTNQNRYTSLVLQHGVDYVKYASAADLPGALEDALPRWQSISDKATTRLAMASQWRDRCKDIINHLTHGKGRAALQRTADQGPPHRRGA